MIAAEIPENEEARVRQLYELVILDTLEEQAYDDLAKLAAEICKTPIALVSLIDRERQWFNSHHGLEALETPREEAFCAHAILGEEVFVVEDTAKDERFCDNPLATGEPYIKFYAGAPLLMSDDIRLGTLCVIGHEARRLTKKQKEALAALARQVVSQLELRLKLKELENLDHAKDEFISMVSHELRTPLTAIHGSLALLHHNTLGELNTEQKQIVDISYRNSNRLIDIVNDILDLAMLESGTFKIKTNVLDMVTLLEKAVELNEQYCKDCVTNLVFTRAEGVATATVIADEQRMLQVMSNLISNAAKFTYDHDIIEIDMEINNGDVIVRVSDHGPGIPLEQHALLFKKFKQLNSQINHKLRGSGLGLNICANIIELQQGEIGFESAPDERTTFYFKLPLMT